MKTTFSSLPPSLRASLAVASTLFVTGCISSKYQSAASDTNPAATLNLTQTHRSIEATLETVIVPNGPGSWKREALWDEYVIAVANRGRATCVIEHAELVDIHGRSVRPGDDPWKLEEETASWWRSSGSDALRDLQHGVGSAGTGAALAVYGIPAVLVASAGAPILAAQILAAGAGYIAVPAALYLNAEASLEAQQKIATRFQTRRERYPRQIAPGQEVHGSLFFPITPGPRQLRLAARVDGKPTTFIIDLTAISHLHGAKPQAAETLDRDPNDLRIVPATVFP